MGTGVTLAHARHGSEQSFGALRLRPSDQSTSVRAMAGARGLKAADLNVGAEASRVQSAYRGAVPYGDINDLDVPVTLFDQTERGTGAGAGPRPRPS